MSNQVYPGADDEERRMTGGPPGYPAYPASSAGQPAEGPAPEQPPSMRTAVRLMWAGAALSLVSLIVTLATLDSLRSHLRQQLADSNSTLSANDLDVVYNTAVVAAVVGSLVAILLWLWMAWKNGQGRSWARIVATVLGVINLLSSAYTILSGRALEVSAILTVVNLLLAIAILVLMWNKESSAFYAESSRRRRLA